MFHKLVKDKDEEKWMKVMTTAMMSSEDSNSEDPDTVVVKPLLWRSQRVTKFFNTIDDNHIQSGSKAKKNTHFQ